MSVRTGGTTSVLTTAEPRQDNELCAVRLQRLLEGGFKRGPLLPVGSVVNHGGRNAVTAERFFNIPTWQIFGRMSCYRDIVIID